MSFYGPATRIGLFQGLEAAVPGAALAIGFGCRPHFLRLGRKNRLTVLKVKFIGFKFIGRVFDEKFY